MDRSGVKLTSAVLRIMAAVLVCMLAACSDTAPTADMQDSPEFVVDENLGALLDDVFLALGDADSSALGEALPPRMVKNEVWLCMVPEEYREKVETEVYIKMDKGMDSVREYYFLMYGDDIHIEHTVLSVQPPQGTADGENVLMQYAKDYYSPLFHSQDIQNISIIEGSVTIHGSCTSSGTEQFRACAVSDGVRWYFVGIECVLFDVLRTWF